MEVRREKEMHDSIGLVGLRAHATAVGLLQLSAELVKAGVLDDAALSRVKDAIAMDLSLTRPRSVRKEDFERSTRRRLDALFSGEEKVSDSDPGLASAND